MHSVWCTMHSVPAALLTGVTMRKIGLALLLVLLASCSTPDRFHDVRTPDPVNATTASGVMWVLMYVIYFLASWLGPKT